MNVKCAQVLLGAEKPLERIAHRPQIKMLAVEDDLIEFDKRADVLAHSAALKMLRCRIEEGLAYMARKNADKNSLLHAASGLARSRRKWYMAKTFPFRTGLQ